MIRVKLPGECADGKQIYNIALQIINRQAPQYAKFIHTTKEFNPFSTVLPDTINVLDPALEVIFKQVPNLEIVDERDRRETVPELDEYIRLRFRDTFFRTAQVSLPLPDPWRIIRSWKIRWNSLFGDKVSINLPIDGPRRGSERVQIRQMRLVTNVVKIADYRPYYAFTGFTRWKWLGSEKELRELWMLARFAEFAGTGAKTTMGCGITKVVAQ